MPGSRLCEGVDGGVPAMGLGRVSPVCVLCVPVNNGSRSKYACAAQSDFSESAGSDPLAVSKGGSEVEGQV